jgi:hypothetical protein
MFKDSSLPPSSLNLCFQYLEKHLGDHVTTKLNKMRPMPTTHMKYVDDMTMAETLNLRQELMPNPNTNLPRPLTYHERTQQILSEGVSQIQEQLNRLVEYCQENEMMINAGKNKGHAF